MFELQVMTMGGRTTVMVNEQLLVAPQVSLALHLTTVVPTANVLPLGGLHTTVGVEQPPLTVGAKNTTAPDELVAWTSMFDGQVMVTCGETVTVKLHVTLLLQLSLAVQVTVVVPTGKVLPLGGLHTTVGVEQPPLTVGAKNTTAPDELVACTSMFDGQVIFS